MTNAKEFTQAVQQLNAHVEDMFESINARMMKKTGKDVFSFADERELVALNASLAQVTRSYCVLMHKYVPDEIRTKIDNIKIRETIKCCDGLIEEAVSTLGDACDRYVVSKEEDEEEDDDDVDMHDIFSAKAQEKRLDFLRGVPKKQADAILKETGLSDEEIEWCHKLIESGDQDMSDEDMEIGLNILKKMHGGE